MAIPDLTRFLTDPAHQQERELMNGVIDARLKHHAEEAKKNAPPAEVNFWDRLFGGTSQK